jgi:hypothetical protein
MICNVLLIVNYAPTPYPTDDKGKNMKWSEWLENWSMTSLKFTPPFLEMEWSPKDPDKNAAWEMYIELLTRITTQSLDKNHGDERSALKSIYAIFGLTREIIKNHGRGCKEFTKIAIVILNQVIRPFTEKWHGIAVKGGFSDSETCETFRKELQELQNILSIYTQMIGEMAGVEEDLTKLE